MNRLFAKGVFAALLGITAAAPLALAHHDTRSCGHTHHPSCESIDGPFTSILIEPPECTSAVGLCTLGDLEGDLKATYAFTADTLMPDTDPAHPGRLLYTGTSIITLQHGGQMFSDDEGFLDPDATGNAMFATTVHVIRGTKHATNTIGTIVASGVLNFGTGNAVGSYTGELCNKEHGRDNDHDHDHDNDHGNHGNHGGHH